MWWAVEAGIDVPALLQRYPDRIEMLHVKDGFIPTPNPAPSSRGTQVPVGEGDVDSGAVVAAARGKVRWYHVEMDPPPGFDPFPMASTSFNNLRGGPAAGLSTLPTEFGSQAAGSMGTGKWVTITNSGDAPLVVDRISIRAAAYDSAGDFLIGEDTCQDAPVAAKSTCQVCVRFAPARENATSVGQLIVHGNTDQPTQWTWLTGRSTARTAGPAGPTGPAGPQGPSGRRATRAPTAPKGRRATRARRDPRERRAQPAQRGRRATRAHRALRARRVPAASAEPLRGSASRAAWSSAAPPCAAR